MKEINMTKAISCMPDKFITMEMVELAATEHRPELVNYLPEKYITSEILGKHSINSPFHSKNVILLL